MENVLLIPTPTAEAGRFVLQSLDDLADADAIELRAAAVVKRYADGRWHFPEETDHVSYRGTITGGALGAVIGLLAGPAGLLLGGVAGLLLGIFDLDRGYRAGRDDHSYLAPPHPPRHHRGHR